MEVPRIELNNATRTREPLLMTLMELERLLLLPGLQQLAEQRMGMTKDEYGHGARHDFAASGEGR